VEYRLTALKAQINPHFISNSLTAIQQLIIQNNIDKANQYIARFSLLIRYVLKYSDKFVTDLDTEIKIIELNVEVEQLRFRDQFIFEKQIAPDVKTNEIYIPPLITQPFIENAIWHGLLPLNESRKPKLTLKIEIRQDNLIISIIDNGVGRNHVSAEKEQQEEARESKGTELIRSKIESLNKMYSTNGILITSIDLKDEQGLASGTQIDLVFPINVLNELYNENDK
jgi:two-component system LytT family sensor kinase